MIKEGKAELRLIEMRRGEKPGTVQVYEGNLPSGKPFRGSVFIPERTAEEQDRWEKNVKDACRDYIDDYIRRNGFERAKAVLGA